VEKYWCWTRQGGVGDGLDADEMQSPEALSDGFGVQFVKPDLAQGAAALGDVPMRGRI